MEISRQSSKHIFQGHLNDSHTSLTSIFTYPPHNSVTGNLTIELHIVSLYPNSTSLGPKFIDFLLEC